MSVHNTYEPSKPKSCLFCAVFTLALAAVCQRKIGNLWIFQNLNHGGDTLSDLLLTALCCCQSHLSFHPTAPCVAKQYLDSSMDPKTFKSITSNELAQNFWKRKIDHMLLSLYIVSIDRVDSFGKSILGPTHLFDWKGLKRSNLET